MFNAATIYSIIFIRSLNHETPINAQFISETTGISVQFLQQLTRKLVAAKLVSSIKGPSGGYILIKDQVSILDIMKALGDNSFSEKHLKEGQVLKKHNGNVRKATDIIHKSYTTVANNLNSINVLG